MVRCFARVLRPLAVVATLIAVAGELTAQPGRSFSTRVSLTVTGDLATVGNTLLTCTAGGSCAAAQAGAAAGLLNNNDSQTMRYVDVDADPSTFNSSQATLTLPTGATVRWAGLYWGGRASPGSKGTSPPDPTRVGEVLLAGPGSGYATVSAAQLDFVVGNFAGFADVTALVQAGGPGAYRVANLQAATGRGSFGGWSLLVAFDLAGAGSSTRLVQVQDGFRVIALGSSAQVPFSGLTTPRTGPVASDVTLVLYDGDRAFTGDQVTLDGQVLSDALNPVGSQLNSSIASLGVRFTQKSPNYDNQLGIDLDRFDAFGILAPGASTATVGVQSPDESFLHVLALSVPQELAADLEVTKTGPTSVPALGSITYAIVALNRGPGVATDVVIEDTLPAGVVFRSATGGGVANGQVVSWPALATLASGAQQTFSVTVQAPVAGTLTNVVASRTSSPDPDPTNNDGSSPNARVVTDVDPRADLAVTKTGPATIAGPGQVTYTVTVANLGPSNASAVVVTDTLPTGATFVSASHGGTVDPAGTIVTWPTIPTLASGGVQTFSITIVSPPGPTFINVAAAIATTSDPDLGNNRGSAVTTVITSSADLEVTKSGPATAQAGGTIDYLVVVRNLGPDPASAVQVTDTLPTGVTFLSASGGGAEAGGVVTWPVIPTLAAGASQTFTVSVQAPSGGPATLVNVAAGAASTPDPDLSNNRGSAITTVTTSSADIEVTKSGPATVQAGGTIAYVVVVRNLGPDPASAVRVTDTLPAGVTFLSASGGGAEAGGVVSWPVIPTLAAGASQTLTVSVRAPSGGPTTLVNVAAGISSTPDPDLSNNNGSSTTSRVTTVITSGADVAVTKTGPATVQAGGTIDYVVVVRNLGPDPASAVQVTDTLPAGVIFLSASGGGAEAGGVVSWPAIPTLAAGASQTFTISVRAPSGGPATLVNVAAATSTTPDPDLSNNNGSATTSRVTTVITSSADIEVTKSGPATVQAGGTIDYVVMVRNLGPDPASAVRVTDTLPAGVTLLSASGGGTEAGGVVSWPAIPTLAAGASQTFTVSVRAPSGGPTTLVNVAAGISSTPDPDLSNNNGSSTTSRVTTVVVTLADVVTTKSGPAVAAPNGNVVYTITVRNDGPNDATNVIVTDTLPGAVSFVSATGGAVLSGSVLTWPTITLLPVGATQSFDVTVTAPATGTFTNVAASTATTSDPNPGNNDGSAPDGQVTTTVADQADVEATKTAPAAVDPLGSLAYTITLTNFGPSPAVDVVLTDTLPAAVTLVSATGGAVLNGRVLTWPTIPILAVNDTLTFTVTVTAPLAGSLTNVVAATSSTPDPDPSNNDGSSPRARPVTQVRPLDVAIAKTHLGDFVAGTVAKYQIVVTNVGAVTTVGPLTVVDTLPASLAVEAASGDGWGCSVSGQVVTCAYPALLPPTASAGFEITVRVLASAVPQVTNRAIVSTPGDEEPTGNNVAEDTVAVSPLPPLVIEKRALRTEVEVGDVVDYQLLVSNVASVTVSDVEVLDTLPLGFSYRSGTARLDGAPLPDPAGAPGPVLRSSIGDLGPNSTVTLSYRLVVGAGATAGDGVNKAFARSIPAGIESPVATARVRFRGGLLDDRAFILGKVAVRYDSAGRRRELGVPGVRVILTDGTSAVTDEEGKYSFYGLAPILHVVRVDETTLPDGLLISVTNARQVGNPLSQLADLKNGELHRADFFAVDGLTPALRATIAERRAQGAIYEAIPDSARATIAADRPVSGVPGAAGIARDRGDSTAIRGAYQSVTGTLAAPIAERQGLARVTLAGSAPPPPVNGDRVVVSVPAETVPADGHSLVAVRVQVVRPGAAATDGVPITLESSLGRWQVDDRDPAEPGIQTVLDRGEATFGLIASAVEGVGEVRVTAGSLSQTATVVFVPALRPMVAAGLLQGRIDFRSLSKGALVSAVPSDGFEQELRDFATNSDDGLDRAAGRGALFLKGKVQGKYLLTLAYDSERDPERQLFRDIRPEEFYPVYGDASVREYGAQSYERLYVRVDRERSFFLYGDFTTPAPSENRELGAYLRTLTGAVQRIENERVQLSAFASRSKNRQVVDEIRGRGVSGPYELSRGDGLINSERIELLTRDRNQPARILRLEPMRRFVDYTIDPFSGRILFRRPVPSVDADLNPVSIRVSYELERDGESEWVYGGDAQLRLSRRLELGGAAVHEDDPFDSFDLLSLNGAFRITPNTVLQAEWARTDGSARDAGDAGRIELRHQGERLDAHLFGAESDSSFSNSSSSFGSGRRELGAALAYRLDGRTRFLGQALSTEDRRSDGRRDGALLAVERRLGRDVRAEVGYRYGHETLEPADSVAPTPNETSAIHTKLSVDFGDSLSSGLRKGAIFGEYDQDLDHGDRRRGAFGAHYQVLPRLRLYGRHEFLSSFAGPFALNGEQRTQATAIGFDGGYAEDGQVFSEYRLRDGLSGRDGEAVMGLRNRWTLARGLRLDASFERIHPTTGGATVGEATAVAGGIEYSTSPSWRGTARLEVRDAASGTTLLATAGYARKLSDDWTTLGRIFWNDLEGDQVRTRGQLGLAWRETSRSRFNGLARLDRRFERLGVVGTDQATHGATVLSAHLNWQATDHLVLSGRWASKWASDSSAGLESATTAHLAMVRGIQDIGRSWDLGVQASTLSVIDAGRRFGLGIELGRRIIDDLRLAVGYNVFGLRDRDIPDTEYTLRGAYVRFDFKFDERLFGRDR